jgi:hypothetical protein
MLMIHPIDKDAFEPYLATKTSTFLSPLVVNSPSRRSPPKGGGGDAKRDCGGSGSDAAGSAGRWKDLLALEGYMVNMKLVNVFAQASGIPLDQAVLQEAFDELLYSAQGETDLKEAVLQSKCPRRARCPGRCRQLMRCQATARACRGQSSASSQCFWGMCV